MRKVAFRAVNFLIGLMIALSLCGCEEAEILQEVLRTASIDSGTEETSEGNGPGQGEESGEENSETDGQTDSRAVPVFLNEEAFCYAYHSLSETEQLWYRDIAESIGDMGEEVKLDKGGIEQGLDERDVDRIFQCVLMDHPELFYVEGYTYTKYNRGDKIIAIRFSGTYSMDREQALARKEEIDEAAQILLNEAAGLTNDYDKVKYVYDTIIKNTEYDLNATDNQNVYSVFVNHRSVCQGYAKSVQYLLDRMGVECALVQGSVDTGEGHAWNLVKVNGSYYYVDATWGDASYQPEEEEVIGYYVPEINYDYLCVTTEQLLRTHILDSYVAMPVCVEVKDNYYVREGAMFTEYDKEQMKLLFESAFDRNKPDVTVKCSDLECFWQILTALIDDQEIFDYLGDSNDTIIYAHNEKQLSMTFWVTNE